VRIAPELIDQIVAHAREEAPNECCGLIAGGDGRAARIFRARNSEASPFRYVVDPRDQIRIMGEIEEAGEELVGIYHSHTRSGAYPSQTDVNLAEGWPDPLYLICSVAGEEPEVRAFAIRDGAIEEVALALEGP
jgi:[CysO sulfur-carrier protein]-S-L-cysteine hydrolase